MNAGKDLQDAQIERIQTYCKERKYQVKAVNDATKVRFDICDLSNRTIVNVFSTGKILVQGKKNPLHEEFLNLQRDIESGGLQGIKSDAKMKASIATYDVMLPELQKHVQDSWVHIAPAYETTISPSPYIGYRSKLSDGRSSVTVTQFSNGKLMLQGKMDYFFSDVCDFLEKTAKPSEKDVAARFVSSDQAVLEAFVAKYTPDLLKSAEKEVETEIEAAYKFIEDHDRKWLIASKCLCKSGILLPEYSPLVMPASKAFEGFVKKLLVAIGLVPTAYFSTKDGSFSILNDKKNPSRIDACSKEKHMDTMLDDLRISLDKFRNFMMHSDGSFITKVETPKAAEALVHEVHKAIKDKFSYFNKVFTLGF